MTQLVENFDEMRHRNRLCRNRNVTFRAAVKPFYSARHSSGFHQLVRSTLGRSGALIVLSVGFHNSFNASRLLRHYLDPAVELIRRFYRGQRPKVKRWPEIVFSLPMRNGLLKPVGHLRLQHRSLLLFESSMRSYFDRNNINVLDFQDLGEKVHSYDGVHYDVTVNLMKTQIILNYLAKLSGGLYSKKTHMS
ncbi:unnamed protein product [Clavelina lepadiformis]|uniref:Uncharacterized protein n=1 Tax=Clavelina lepadiformis TaxID=159417 RepID=A0ABP0FYA8_CLALP